MANGALSLRAQEALQRTASAARAGMRRVKEREQKLKAGAIGLGAGYFGAGFWARRRAVEDRDGKKAAFELGPVEIDGKKLGAGIAIAGAMGVMNDDVYDDALYAGGVAVMAADVAIDEYKEELEKPPAAAGGG